MFSIANLLKGAAAVSAAAIALCLVANSAAADGKRADAEYHVSSSKTVKTVKTVKPAEVRVVSKYQVIHRNAPQTRSGRK